MESALASSQRIIDTSTPKAFSPKSLLLLGMEWSGLKPAGMDRYTYNLVKELSQRHHVEFCGVGVDPTLKAPLNTRLINLASPEIPVLPRLMTIHQKFRQYPFVKVDAVNLQFALYSFPIIHGLPKDVPVTFTFHGPWFQESQYGSKGSWKNRAQHWLERYVYDRCDRFIVMSQSFGQVLHQNYQVPEAKIHVIPSAINLDTFYPAANVEDVRAELNWSADRFVLFTARRFVHRMGIQPLIAAVDLVRKQHPEVLLAIAGTGELAASFKQQVQELGLNNHVQFLGFLPEPKLLQCYQAANLTVVPSQSLEGFGLVVIESLACGTPVLCTPVGGMQEIMSPLAPDLITPSCRTQDIAAHISAVLRGELDLPSATHCRAYVEKNYSWPSIARQVETVLF